MSLKIITFANHKGGVSKTTSTASIGACMARMGKKVLLIDLDGQANLTLYFIPNEDEVQASIFDSLVDGAPLPVKHIRENLDLVPSSLEMASAGDCLDQSPGKRTAAEPTARTCEAELRLHSHRLSSIFWELSPQTLSLQLMKSSFR